MILKRQREKKRNDFQEEKYLEEEAVFSEKQRLHKFHHQIMNRLQIKDSNNSKEELNHKSNGEDREDCYAIS